MTRVTIEAERCLEALDPEQREAAAATRGPVCVIAGAGTGKTRAITQRIAYAALIGDVSPEHVLALTFTTRAAGELRARLHGLGVDGVEARTFHSAALSQLVEFWPQVAGGRLPRIVESKQRLVADAVSRCAVDVPGAVIRDITLEIDWAKASLITTDDYVDAATRAMRRPPIPAADVARVYSAYDELLAQTSTIDLDDVLLLAAGLLERYDDVARSVRARYRHFVVDEYQDVNPAQQRLLDAWLGSRDDICVVGDANQTIYTFTGASPRYLLTFAERFPDATVVRLTRDYRSTPQVVNFANSLLAAMPKAVGVMLQGQRADGPEPAINDYPDDETEASAVAAHCKQLIDAGHSPREIAVLFRTNAQSTAYAEALSSLGIPFAVRGSERFFERPEVKQAVGVLRASLRSADPAQPTQMPHAALHLLTETGWAPDPPDDRRARDRWESLAAIVDLARGHQGDLAGFVAELARRAEAAHPPTADAVTLASLHAAKGLEWDTVFLVGVSEGLLPIAYAFSDNQLAEEARLLYVGVTRARERLTLSWSRARAPGGRLRAPSRFIEPLSTKSVVRR